MWKSPKYVITINNNVSFQCFRKGFSMAFKCYVNVYLFLFVSFMLQKLKDMFMDPLFYWICLDYFLTLMMVYYWFGMEINPTVLTMWFTPAFIMSLLLYLFYIPKNVPNDIILWDVTDLKSLKYDISVALLGYYLYLNMHHIFILLWY